MRIFLASDLHAEFRQPLPLPVEPVDAVVLAGDINSSTQAVDDAQWYHEQTGADVILVAGNHEYYHGDFDNTLSAMRAAAADLEHVHFLENDSKVLNNVRFLGCTLWSDFEINGLHRRDACKAFAANYINDYQAIRYQYRSLHPEDTIARFRHSKRWLQTELARPFDGNTVVVTHFGPNRAAIHPRYLVGEGADELTPYFVSDCSDLLDGPPIAAWFYGHTHGSVDVMLDGGTRLVSNQRGYPNEDPDYTAFDPHKIILIERR